MSEWHVAHFIGLRVRFNVVEHPRDKLVPVLIYVIAAIKQSFPVHQPLVFSLSLTHRDWIYFHINNYFVKLVFKSYAVFRPVDLCFVPRPWLKFLCLLRFARSAFSAQHFKTYRNVFMQFTWVSCSLIDLSESGFLACPLSSAHSTPAAGLRAYYCFLFSCYYNWSVLAEIDISSRQQLQLTCFVKVPK